MRKEMMKRMKIFLRNSKRRVRVNFCEVKMIILLIWIVFFVFFQSSA